MTVPPRIGPCDGEMPMTAVVTSTATLPELELEPGGLKHTTCVWLIYMADVRMPN